jgi:hypothetical protein
MASSLQGNAPKIALFLCIALDELAGSRLRRGMSWYSISKSPHLMPPDSRTFSLVLAGDVYLFLKY